MMEMTQEWITQFNKKCAEFIGAYFCDDDKREFPNGYWLIDDYYRELPLHLDQFEFHSDWNWIMEVCIKISSLRSDDTFEGLNSKVFEIRHSMFWELIDDKNEFLLKIEKFIDWYNKQKES